MLTMESLKAALPLATVLDSRGLILTPVTGSPLDAIVAATRSDTNFNDVVPEGMDRSAGSSGGVSAGCYTPDIVNIEYIANCKSPELKLQQIDPTIETIPNISSQHDLVMDHVVSVASEAIRNHMIFAKDVVAAAVENLVTRTQTVLATLTPSALMSMEVVVYNPPKPLTNSNLESAVRKFSDLPFDIPVMNMKLPTISASEIVELMKTGSRSLDDDITEWVASKGDLFFINIWENVFQIKQAELHEREPITFKTFLFDSVDAIDNALAVYLLARKLEDGPLPDTEMNLNAYNKTIIEYRNHAAHRLSIAFDELDKISKAGLLVRKVEGSVTTVNGDVYAKWIEAGGDNEVLFGNALSAGKEVTLSAIDANASTLKELWVKHATLISSVERNRLFNRTKEILSHEFNKQLVEVSDDEVGGPDSRANIIKAFNDCLTNLREDELQDLWDAVLKLLCASRFVRTEARRILLGIERVKKENPHVDVRECAAISMIEYCAWWLTSQFKVTVKV